MSVRTIFAALIAVAVAVAPIGTAWRTTPAVAVTPHAHTAEMSGDSAREVSTDVPEASASTESASHADMADCGSMRHRSGPAAGKTACPCCDSQSPCPPDHCFCKTFQMLAVLFEPATVSLRVAASLHPGEPERPPDWSDAPQPPPPRA